MGKCTCNWCDPSAYRDFKDGAVAPEFGEEEINYSPKKRRKNSVKKYPGCPGNDRGSHVYIWTTEYNTPNLFSDYYGFHKREKKICAGCEHIDKTRLTDEYRERNDKFKEKRARRGERIWKWISFEDYDEDYRAARKHCRDRYGWHEYIYDGYMW